MPSGEAVETTTLVAAPATHSARPVMVAGATRPTVNGEQTYTATTYAQPNGANIHSRTVTYSAEVQMEDGPPPPGTIVFSGIPGANGPASGTVITTTEVEGPAPQRPGNYTYKALPPPLPPSLVVEGGPPGPPSGAVSYSYQSYVTSSTESAPGQPLPGVQYYSSNQPVPLALPPRRTTAHDSLI